MKPIKDDTNKIISEETSEIFKTFNQLKLEPSPYLRTRVLANAREGLHAKKRKRLFYLWPALSTGILTILLLLGPFMYLNNGQDVYFANQSYMVRVDIRPINNNDVAYVKISLNGNIAFSSNAIQDISSMKELTLSWENFVGKQYLPVVIKGIQEGKGNLVVTFYNSNEEVITTKNINFNFRNS